MDARTWAVPLTILVVIAVPILAIVAYMVRESIQARKNRVYKTLAEHSILNASDRDTWMSGVVPEEEAQQVDRFSSRIVPIAQLVTVVVLAAIVLVWNNTLVSENNRQQERLDQLELQVHALAVTPTTVTPREPETANLAPGVPAPQVAGGTPMQQACANLIGRVADAYEKGESSKIALSLEELVKKLGCQNNTPVP
jgi:flagellar basal body-associated protein FliL